MICKERVLFYFFLNITLVFDCMFWLIEHSPKVCNVETFGELCRTYGERFYLVVLPLVFFFFLLT